MADIKLKNAVLETKLENIERYVFRDLKAQASAILKTENPQISYVKENENFKLEQPLTVLETSKSYEVTLRVLEIQEDRIVVKPYLKDVTAGIQFNMDKVEPTIIAINPGKPSELIISFDVNNRRLPPIRIAVLKRPPRDTLILATDTSGAGRT